MTEAVLIDFFYAHPVGHAIEALAHAYALHVADPTREISILLNAATPTELAGCCPFLAATYAVAAPFAEPAPPTPTRQLRRFPANGIGCCMTRAASRSSRSRTSPGCEITIAPPTVASARDWAATRSASDRRPERATNSSGCGCLQRSEREPRCASAPLRARRSR